MNETRRLRWGAAAAGVLAAEAVLVAAAFAWVAVCSYVIHPGETPAFYEGYALSSSPWVSFLLGMPVFYLTCRWIGSRHPEQARPTAMAIFGIYLVLDASLTLLAGPNPNLSAMLLAGNHIGKLLACHLGGGVAAGKESPRPE